MAFSSNLYREGVTFAAPTQVWHASAECSGRTLPALEGFDEFIEGSIYNVLETIDGPPALTCPFCGPRPPHPLPHHPLASPLFIAARTPIQSAHQPQAINRALQPSPPPVARVPPPTPAAAALSGLSTAPALPTTVATSTTSTTKTSAPTANLLPAQAVAIATLPAAATAAHGPSCGCIAPKLGSVIDNSELLSGDILQYSNGAQVVYVRKQGADAYIFDRVTGGQLGKTHQGPKSIATALARGTGRKVEKSVWGEFEVFREEQHLGTLFDIRHAAFVAGRLT